jgi:cytochrome b561
MRRRTFELVVDWLLVGAGTLAFGTGLVLLLGLHVGYGAIRPELGGLGRFVWLDLHRIAAIATATGMTAHVVTHLRPLTTRVRRSLRAWPDRRALNELALYFVFPCMVLTGLVAWLAMGGSVVPSAPVRLPGAHDAHHMVIDVHNVAGLVALVVTVLHLKPRVRRLHPVARGRCAQIPDHGVRRDVRL